MSNTGGIGFFSGNKEKAEENEYQRMKEAVMEEVKRAFKPEFINRLDDVVVFRHLNRDDMRLIVNILIKELELRLKEHGMTIELTDDVKDKVATEGYKRAFGARPMKRSIQKLLEDEISDELINERLGAGNKVKASLVFDAEFPKEKDYSKEEKQPTDDTKEADIRQALIKAKVKFEVIGQYTEEEQEALKKSTIKTKKKVLTLSSTGASVGGASKEPAGNKTA
jgi:ATP-dependent Clp protease ATP-binding subunit ClpC